MSFIVEIRNIIKNYGSITAVDNVSFAVKEGEFFSILGPSGCGKTTILRIIGGFIEQNSGNSLNRWNQHARDCTKQKKYKHGFPESCTVSPYECNGKYCLRLKKKTG